MVIIAPSLLSSDYSRLAEEVRAVEDAGADWHHVDVMDGHFVPNITIGPPVVKALKKVAQKPLDVHVMIEEPLRYVKPFCEAGADIYTFHVESRDEPDAVIEAVRTFGNVRVGITLNPGTPIEKLAPYLDRVDMVLVMSVNPGFGAQDFIEDSLDRVRELRVKYGFRGDLEIDGGIKVHNAAAVARAGVNVLVSGSGIFKSGDLRGTISSLRAAADDAYREGGWPMD